MIRVMSRRMSRVMRVDEMVRWRRMEGSIREGEMIRDQFKRWIRSIPWIGESVDRVS